MNVVDTEKKIFHQAGEALEAERQKNIKALQDVRSRACEMAEYCFSHAEAGNILRTEDFERRLKPLIPAAKFVKFQTFPNYHGKLMRALWVLVDGTPVSIAYDTQILPERTIRAAIPRKIVDPEYLVNPSGKSRVIKPGDVPKAAGYAPDTPLGNGDFIPGKSLWDKNTKLPGFTYYYEPGRELIRGYGAVLTALVHYGVITPTQAMTEFPPQSALYAKGIGLREEKKVN